MVSKFIERPILSIVMSIFIVIIGLISLLQLPITQFPNIAPPEVNVVTKYTGANADAAVKAVVTPLERAINGVPGMSYMGSVSGNDGTSIIQIIFDNSTDPDMAAVNVQNRVSSVIDELPEEVIKAGVIVEKVQNAMLLYINLLSEESEVDEKFLYNYADINILSELKRIEGVGFAEIMGAKEYSVRVWLNPYKMSVYEISTNDVLTSLRQQNIEAAPGKIGESSGRKSQAFQYVIKYSGKFTKPEQYENIIIRSNEDGELIKLKDIAEIELGAIDYNVISKENGKPSAAILIKQRPGSNANEVIKNIKSLMTELEKNFPVGIKYTYSYDVSKFLEASINEVIKTLIEAFILVSLVVFIFLQDWRSTLIPALTVPVSLIGTFTFMMLFGFSLNLITLFALVLSIGIVVDNAIVVIEAVHAKMEISKLNPREATKQAMNEISGAIVAITLVMSSVFIPVAFISGATGVFYREFSLTIAIAIIISGFVALTLTPVTCILILKEHKHDENEITKKNFLTKFFHVFNLWYNGLSNKYQKLLSLVANRRLVTLIMLVAFIAFTGVFGKILPTSFIPNEDQGTIYANINSPSGSTVERTENITDEIQKVAQSLDGINSVSSLAGFSLLSDGYGASYGMNLISLKPWEDREESDKEIINILREKTSHLKDAKIEFFTPPPVPGFGNSSGFELRLLDKGKSGDLKLLETVANEFVEELNKRPELSNVFSSFDASFPQLLVDIDYDKAAQKGVIVEDILSTLQVYLGSEYATNFIRFGQLYKVMVQASPEYREKPEDLLNLYVKNKDSEMVPMSAFINVSKVYGPEQITRYNMYTAAMINGEPAKGFSSGQAINAIKEVAASKLPKGFGYDWAGATREQASASNDSIIIFLICLLFVYLLLSAQYESFILPFPVILSLPTGIFGAFLFLMLLGLENNIYAQISLVMLIGLLGKNAILIIEFAEQRRKEGYEVLSAVIEGATSRLRPILMTSFAFVAGLIPLMLASGAGEIGNKTIGSAAAGGMIIGTIFGVIIVPGLYILFSKSTKKVISK